MSVENAKRCKLVDIQHTSHEAFGASIFFFFFLKRKYISLNKQEESYREPAKQDKENN